MKRFNITVFLILILLIIFGGIYYSNKVDRLEESVEILKDDLIELTFSKPKLINNTSAVITKADGVLVPKIVYRDTGSFKQAPITLYDTIKNVDTFYVMKEFFSLNFFKDSIQSQDVNIIVKDTIQKNSIFARSYSVENLRTEEFYERRMVYIGGTFGFNDEVLIGPSLNYLDKKNNSFGINYLFSPNNKRTVLLSYSKKISFKK